MRKSGIYLGSIRGTTISVEISFMVLLGLFVLLDLENRVAVPKALLWIPVVFLGVLLHELGHAAAIGAFGYGASAITLAGFGGVTVNPRRAKPWHDLVISVAGPVTSLALAGVAWSASIISPGLKSDPFFDAILPMMVEANILWGIFNLFPVIPLDGGHAFLNLMRLATSPRTAVNVTIWLSLIVSIALIVGGIYLRWYFVAIIAAMLLMQNFERFRMLRRPPPPTPPDDESNS